MSATCNFIVFLVCAALFGFAFRRWRVGAHRAALLLVILAGLVLRVFAASDPCLHMWDERYHALVAKHLMQHPFIPTLFERPVLPYDVRAWTANHIWLEKGPVPLLSIAASLRAFGVHEYAVRVPSVLLSLLSVYLTYLVSKTLFGKADAVLAAFYQAINGLVIEAQAGRVSSDHVEVHLLFFVQLAALLAVLDVARGPRRYSPPLIGAAIGAAFLCKWFPALVVLPVWLAGLVVVQNRSPKRGVRDVTVALLSTAVVAVPYLAYINWAFPEATAVVLAKYSGGMWRSLDDHSGPWYFYLVKIGVVFGELAYVPLAWALLRAARRDWRFVMLATWWVVPLLVFSAAETKRPTYLLVFAPAVFILAGHCMVELQARARSWAGGRRVAAVLVMLLLVAMPVRYAIDRVTPFEYRLRNPSWSEPVRNLGKRVGAGDRVVVFNVEQNIEAMFYSDLTVYDFVPDPATVERLTGEGYRVVVNQDGHLSLPPGGLPHAQVMELVRK
jgi:4-amino-4-deoxy-L-arabinose transferase-like glycosyltransferase